MRKFLAAFVASMWCLGASPEASAAVVTITYDGTLSSGYDQFGFWGLGADQDLTGLAFNLVFTLDTSQAALVSSNDGTLGYNALLGGMTAVLTINNIPVHVDDSQGSEHLAEVQTYPTTPFQQSETDQWVWNDYGSVYATAFAHDLTTFPLSPTAAFHYQLDGLLGPLYGSGSFSFEDDPNAINTFGNLNPGSVSLAASPLPSTWSMMLAAMAGLGFIAYRRRRLVAGI